MKVPRNGGKNMTLLSSMTIAGMGPSLAVEGATTARVFETYVEKVLAPSLKPGQMVVMPTGFPRNIYWKLGFREQTLGRLSNKS